MKAQDASQAKMAEYMDNLSTGVISPYKDGKDVETLERVSQFLCSISQIKPILTLVPNE
jgi:hypothetical protein